MSKGCGPLPSLPFTGMREHNKMAKMHAWYRRGFRLFNPCIKYSNTHSATWARPRMARQRMTRLLESSTTRSHLSFLMSCPNLRWSRIHRSSLGSPFLEPAGGFTFLSKSSIPNFLMSSGVHICGAQKHEGGETPRKCPERHKRQTTDFV